MSFQPDKTPSRPTVSEAAEHIIGNLDVSLPKFNQTELLVDVYSRNLAENTATGGEIDHAAGVLLVERLCRSTDTHLDRTKRLKINSHLQYSGRFFSDFRIVQLPHEPVSTHALLEIRLSGGAQVLLCENRLIPIAGGAAMTHLELVPRSAAHELNLRPMLSPEAYTAEMRNFIDLIKQGSPQNILERNSFIYCSFRSGLTAKFPRSAAATRELNSLRYNGPETSPQFVFSFSEREQFVVSPVYLPDRCAIGHRINLLGFP